MPSWRKHVVERLERETTRLSLATCASAWSPVPVAWDRGSPSYEGLNKRLDREMRLCVMDVPPLVSEYCPRTFEESSIHLE